MASTTDLICDPEATPLPGAVLSWCPVPGCTWGVCAPDQASASEAYAEHVIEMTDFARKVAGP